MVMSGENFETSAKARITGALMANYNQKAVILMGELMKVDADSKRATLKTTDDHFIQVIFIQPLQRPLTPQLLTEVQGIVMTKNQLQCHRLVQFKPETSQMFDRETYNEFVTEFVKNCDEHVNCMTEDGPEDSVIVPTDNFSLPEDMAIESTNSEAPYQSNNSYF